MSDLRSDIEAMRDAAEKALKHTRENAPTQPGHDAAWREAVGECRGEVEAYKRVLTLLDADRDEGLELDPEVEEQLRQGPGPLYRMKNEGVLAEGEALAIKTEIALFRDGAQNLTPNGTVLRLRNPTIPATKAEEIVRVLVLQGESDASRHLVEAKRLCGRCKQPAIARVMSSWNTTYSCRTHIEEEEASGDFRIEYFEEKGDA